MRKQAARGAVASVLILLAGCSPPAPTPPPEAPAASGAATPSTVVRVYNWEEYIDPEVLAEFTAETGLQVDYQTFPGNEDLQALINAGQPFADVVFPTAIPFGREQVQARQLAELAVDRRDQGLDLRRPLVEPAHGLSKFGQLFGDRHGRRPASDGAMPSTRPTSRTTLRLLS